MAVPAASRRSFLKACGAGFILALAPALEGCDAYTEFVTGERAFTDDAGRELTLPTASNIQNVYFTSSLAQVFCFTMDPSLLGGTGIRFTDLELEYLPEGTADLTYLGTMAGDGEIDPEMLMRQDIDIVFSISGTGLTAANVSDAETLQKKIGVPVVCLDGSFDHIADCYRTLGAVLGNESRGAELGAYCERVYADVVGALEGLDETDKISVYYAEGPEGLQTEPTTSMHAQSFEIAGAKNVAEVPENVGIGMSNVSLEQVLAWDPEVIVAWDWDVRGGADEDIRANAAWAPIRAVADGRVYTMPNIPFAWLDRPPGVNRLIGIQWLANLLYPGRYDVDIVEEIKTFYATFYFVDITDEEAIGFLGNSYRA